MVNADFLSVPGTSNRDWNRDRAEVVRRYEIEVALGVGYRPVDPRNFLDVMTLAGARSVLCVSGQATQGVLGG